MHRWLLEKCSFMYLHVILWFLILLGIKDLKGKNLYQTGTTFICSCLCAIHMCTTPILFQHKELYVPLEKSPIRNVRAYRIKRGNLAYHALLLISQLKVKRSQWWQKFFFLNWGKSGREMGTMSRKLHTTYIFFPPVPTLIFLLLPLLLIQWNCFQF